MEEIRAKFPFICMKENDVEKENGRTKQKDNGNLKLPENMPSTKRVPMTENNAGPRTDAKVTVEAVETVHVHRFACQLLEEDLQTAVGDHDDEPVDAQKAEKRFTKRRSDGNSCDAEAYVEVVAAKRKYEGEVMHMEQGHKGDHYILPTTNDGIDSPISHGKEAEEKISFIKPEVPSIFYILNDPQIDDESQQKLHAVFRTFRRVSKRGAKLFNQSEVFGLKRLLEGPEGEQAEVKFLHVLQNLVFEHSRLFEHDGDDDDFDDGLDTLGDGNDPVTMTADYEDFGSYADASDEHTDEYANEGRPRDEGSVGEEENNAEGPHWLIKPQKAQLGRPENNLKVVDQNTEFDNELSPTENDTRSPKRAVNAKEEPMKSDSGNHDVLESDGSPLHANDVENPVDSPEDATQPPDSRQQDDAEDDGKSASTSDGDSDSTVSCASVDLVHELSEGSGDSCDSTSSDASTCSANETNDERDETAASDVEPLDLTTRMDSEDSDRASNEKEATDLANNTNLDSMNKANLDYVNKANSDAMNKTHFDFTNKANVDSMNKANLYAMNKANFDFTNKANVDSMNKANLDAMNKANLDSMNKANIDCMNKANLDAMNKAIGGGSNHMSNNDPMGIMDRANTDREEDADVNLLNVTNKGNKDIAKHMHSNYSKNITNKASLDFMNKVVESSHDHMSHMNKANDDETDDMINAVDCPMDLTNKNHNHNANRSNKQNHLMCKANKEDSNDSSSNKPTHFASRAASDHTNTADEGDSEDSSRSDDLIDRPNEAMDENDDNQEDDDDDDENPTDLSSRGEYDDTKDAASSNRPEDDNDDERTLAQAASHANHRSQRLVLRQLAGELLVASDCISAICNFVLDGLTTATDTCARTRGSTTRPSLMYSWQANCVYQVIVLLSDYAEISDVVRTSLVRRHFRFLEAVAHQPALWIGNLALGSLGAFEASLLEACLTLLLHVLSSREARHVLRASRLAGDLQLYWHCPADTELCCLANLVLSRLMSDDDEVRLTVPCDVVDHLVKSMLDQPEFLFLYSNVPKLIQNGIQVFSRNPVNEHRFEESLARAMKQRQNP